MIREAEQNGNAFAAIWHLDRLIAAHPDDWFLYARRGRARSLSDNFDKAAADFQKAERLSSRDQVLDFQTHCVLDCTKAERWAAALWYLDRLIAAGPKHASLHLDRTAVYGELGREAARQAELARVFEAGRRSRAWSSPGPRNLAAPAAGARPRACWQAAVGEVHSAEQLAQAWAIACLQARKGSRGLPRGLRGGPGLAGIGPDGCLERLERAASVFALGPEACDRARVPIASFRAHPPRPARPEPFGEAATFRMRSAAFCSAPADWTKRLPGSMKESPPRRPWRFPPTGPTLHWPTPEKGKPAEGSRKMLERSRDWRPDSSSTFWDLREELLLLRSEAQALPRGAARRSQRNRETEFPNAQH